MDSAELNSLRDDKAEIAWREVCRVTTDIHYSSLLCERIASKNFKRFFTALAFYMALPALIEVVKKTGYIEHQAVFWVIEVVLILVPVVIRVGYIEFFKKFLTFGDKEKEELLKLNTDLEIFKRRLLVKYMSLENATSKQMVDNLMKEYNALCVENQKLLTKHDELTGELDDALVKKAQDKANEELSHIKLS